MVIKMTLKWINNQNNNLWILIIVILSYIKIANTIPAIGNRTNKSISIGPCTWVIDRKCPDIDVKFYLFTRDNPQDRQFIYIDDTWEKSNLSTSYFNPFHPNKIIIHGYNSDMFLNPLIQMKNEYLERGDYNLFFVDWSVLAPGPCYIMAVHNARHVGHCIAQLVDRILDIGNIEIHVIGFSLGAQVTNFVAQNLPDFKLPRITGLDPAMPLFITASNENKLDPSDADFVDVIHTNALVQGKIERCGHVDFYMNGGIMQPGCFRSGQNPFACSHQRAPDYFSESIRSLKGFWGWTCSSYIMYLLGMCPPTNFLVIAGEDCRPDSRHGMYLITTESESPFAIGKWTELNDLTLKVNAPILQREPFEEEIDKWGKLDGDFNNKLNNPTPYSQDPQGSEWPYFNHMGANQITNKYIEKIKKQQQLIRDMTNGQLNNKENIKKILSLINNSTYHTHRNSSKLHHNLVENYKRNLTNGIRNPEVFSIPTVLDNK